MKPVYLLVCCILLGLLGGAVLMHTRMAPFIVLQEKASPNAEYCVRVLQRNEGFFRGGLNRYWFEIARNVGSKRALSGTVYFMDLDSGRLEVQSIEWKSPNEVSVIINHGEVLTGQIIGHQQAWTQTTKK